MIMWCGWECTSAFWHYYIYIYMFIWRVWEFYCKKYQNTEGLGHRWMVEQWCWSVIGIGLGQMECRVGVARLGYWKMVGLAMVILVENPASAATEVFASANWLGQSTLPGRLASRNAPRWARGLKLERICCRVRHGFSKKLGNEWKWWQASWLFAVDFTFIWWILRVLPNNFRFQRLKW